MALHRLTLIVPCAASLMAAVVEPPPADAGGDVEVHALGDVMFIDDDRWVAAARRTPQPISLAPAAVTVLDPGDMVYSPAITYPDLLRYQAGVDVYQMRHGQFEVGLRGFTANGVNAARTLTYFDDRPFIFEQLGSPIWIGLLHLSDVDRVEILKGPSSVAYGANAFGGVISLGRRPWGDEPELRTIQQYGSHGLVELDGTATTPLGENGIWQRVSLKVSAGLTQRNDLPGETGTNPIGPEHPRLARSGDKDIRSWRSTMLVGIELPADHLLEFEWAHLDIDTWNLLEDYVAGADVVVTKQDTFSVRMRAPWGEIRHLRQQSNHSVGSEKTAYGLQPDFWYFQAGFDDVWDQTRLQINQQIGNHAITAGAEYTYFDSDSNLWGVAGLPLDESTWENSTWSNMALFAEDQWMLDGQWAVTAGLRIDHHSDLNTNTSPRLAVNYQQSAETFWRMSLSSGYRLPNSLELHLDSRYFASNSDIEAETIIAIDLGWQRVYSDHALEINANAFYSRVDDLIAFQPIPESQMAANWDTWMADRVAEFLATGSPDLRFGPGHFFEFTNLDNPLHSYGLELSAEWQPLSDHDWTVWGNATWNQSRYEDDIILQSDGFVGSGPPALGGGQTQFRFNENLGKKINTAADWKLSAGTLWRWGGLFAGAAARFVDEREVFSIAYSMWDDDEVRRQTIDAYVTVDLTAGYSWGDIDDPDGYIKFSALNITDTSRRYEFHNPDAALLNWANDLEYASSVGTELAVTAVFNF